MIGLLHILVSAYIFNMCVQMDPSKKSYSYIHTVPKTNSNYTCRKQIGKLTKAA